MRASASQGFPPIGISGRAPLRASAHLGTPLARIAPLRKFTYGLGGQVRMRAPANYDQPLITIVPRREPPRTVPVDQFACGAWSMSVLIPLTRLARKRELRIPKYGSNVVARMRDPVRLSMDAALPIRL